MSDGGYRFASRSFRSGDGAGESVGCAAAEPARGAFISLQAVFEHMFSVMLRVRERAVAPLPAT